MMSRYTVGSEAWYEANPQAPSRGEADQDAWETKMYYQKHPEKRVRTEARWRNLYTPEQLAEIEADIPF